MMGNRPYAHELQDYQAYGGDAKGNKRVIGGYGYIAWNQTHSQTKQNQGQDAFHVRQAVTGKKTLVAKNKPAAKMKNYNRQSYRIGRRAYISQQFLDHEG